MKDIRTIKGLTEYAENLGLEVPADVADNFNQLRAFIRRATGETEVEETAAPPVEKAAVKRVKIIIQPSDTDNQPVFVGVNGIGYAIKRGHEVSVPIGVVDVLNGAVKSIPVKDDNNRIVGWKDAQMYPFSIVS